MHQKFLQWSRAGVLETRWKAGLAEYDELEGIAGVAWRWHSLDGRCSRRRWLRVHCEKLEHSSWALNELAVAITALRKIELSGNITYG